MIAPLPAARLHRLNAAPVRDHATHVLYWMTSARRSHWNFGLQRAIWHAQQRRLPLVVLEALRIDYPWAAPRFHAFVVQGMRDNRVRFSAHGITYLPYVEPANGAGKGLVAALSESASVVVTDLFPGFFLPRMTRAFAERAPCAVEAIDSNGLLPLAATPHAFTTAYAFRCHLHRCLLDHVGEAPLPDPLPFAAGLPSPAAALLQSIATQWPSTDLGASDAIPGGLLGPGVVATYPGGPVAAEAELTRFIAERLPTYAERRADVEADAGSHLSPYLHFGHISAHAVFDAVARHEGWDLGGRLLRAEVGQGATKVRLGSREGWWGMSAAAEAFVDQLITWRELGYGFAFHRPLDHERYESLPDWARTTLDAHADDLRPHLYSLDELDAGDTHDPIWNAAQNQLRHEGRIHNYLRMLWGKKVLEWSPSPQEALSRLIELNNRYALDGRNPNSTSGIFWTLGRFDRPWAPTRPIFGSIRYMSSDATRRKLRLDAYLSRWRS